MSLTTLSADAVALARMYDEAKRQFDAAPATDKILRAALDARRVAWAVHFAEELAPAILRDREPGFTPRFTPLPWPPVAFEEADEHETAMRAAAHRSSESEPGVGTIGPRPREVQP